MQHFHHTTNLLIIHNIMPSLKKVVEDVEVNTLPSPTKILAARSRLAASTSSCCVDTGGSTGIDSRDNPNGGDIKPAPSLASDGISNVAAKGSATRRTWSKMDDDSDDEDEEDISLKDQEQLKASKKVSGKNGSSALAAQGSTDDGLDTRMSKPDSLGEGGAAVGSLSGGSTLESGSAGKTSNTKVSVSVTDTKAVAEILYGDEDYEAISLKDLEKTKAAKQKRAQAKTVNVTAASWSCFNCKVSNLPNKRLCRKCKLQRGWSCGEYRKKSESTSNGVSSGVDQNVASSTPKKSNARPPSVNLGITQPNKLQQQTKSEGAVAGATTVTVDTSAVTSTKVSRKLAAPPAAAAAAAASAPQYTPQQAMERWSEYMIDAANSVGALEGIRHRLLNLLDRTDMRLKERRFNDAMVKCSGDDGLQDPEKLVRKLSEEVHGQNAKRAAYSSNAQGGDNKKRSQSESNSNEEKDKPSPKRQRAICCPLCLHSNHASAADPSFSTCDFCDESDICARCCSYCEKCHRTACFDCLMSCDSCGTSNYCSDCISAGNGECAVCVKSKATKNPPATSKGIQSALQRGNQMIGLLNRTTTAPKAPSLPPIQKQTAGKPPAGKPPAAKPPPAKPPAVKPPPAKPPAAKLPAAKPPAAKPPPAKPPPAKPPTAKPPTVKPAAAVKPHAPIQTATVAVASGDQTQQPLHANIASIHRFVIFEEGPLGMSIVHDLTTSSTIVRTVKSYSTASNHGVQVGDVISLPNSKGDKVLNTYRSFCEACKSRPLLFEVKRLSNGGHFVLHRLVFYEEGMLGLRIQSANGRTRIEGVDQNIIAQIHGVLQDDIICKPFTNGAHMNFEWVKNKLTQEKRPLVLELWRSHDLMPAMFDTGDTGADSWNPFRCPRLLTLSAAKTTSIQKPSVEEELPSQSEVNPKAVASGEKQP